MRAVACTIAVVSLLSLQAAKSEAQEVKSQYFLPKSIITVSATVTTKNTFPSDPRQGMAPKGSAETSAVGVTLANVADPSWPLFLTSEAALLSKNTMSVEVSSAGLLTSVNAKSEGVLGSVIKNIFGAVVTLAKASSGLRMSAATDPEKKYEADEPVASKRRSDLKAAIPLATNQVIELEKRLIQSDRPDERKALRARIDDLQQALTTLRSELALADTHFASWKSRLEDAKEQQLEQVIDVDSLADDGPMQKLAASAADTVLLEAVVDAACTIDGVVQKGCALGDIVKLARVAVTTRTPATEPDVKVPVKAHDVNPAIYYRAARPVVLTVYVLNSGNKPVLSKQSTEFVTGRRSQVLGLAIQNSKWTTKSLGVTFANGLLTKLTTEIGSDIAGAAEALKGIPDEYLAAIKQANEIVSEQNKLKTAGVQAQIDQLKKEKELIEARVASGESADLANMQAQAARLDAELKVLTSQRALAAGTQASGADEAAMTLQLQMIKLQNDLADAQVKQLQLQQQIEELKKKAGGAQ